MRGPPIETDLAELGTSKLRMDLYGPQQAQGAQEGSLQLG